MLVIKTITKKEVELLLEKKILFNTRNGIVDKDGNEVQPAAEVSVDIRLLDTEHVADSVLTADAEKNKTRYIEEKYADIAKKLAIV